MVYDVMQHELYAAQRGRGATLNGEPIRVSGLADMQPGDGGGRMVVALAAGALHRRCRQAEERGGANVRRAGSGTLGIAYVADGRTDAYCELHINSWDVLAGLLLVEEAGGWTNNFLAKDGLRKGNPVLACTPELADALDAGDGNRARSLSRALF